MYTTHGYMTPEDYRDHVELYDLDAGADEEPESEGEDDAEAGDA